MLLCLSTVTWAIPTGDTSLDWRRNLYLIVGRYSISRGLNGWGAFEDTDCLPGKYLAKCNAKRSDDSQASGGEAQPRKITAPPTFFIRRLMIWAPQRAHLLIDDCPLAVFLAMRSWRLEVSPLMLNAIEPWLLQVRRDTPPRLQSVELTRRSRRRCLPGQGTTSGCPIRA